GRVVPVAVDGRPAVAAEDVVVAGPPDERLERWQRARWQRDVAHAVLGTEADVRRRGRDVDVRGLGDDVVVARSTEDLVGAEAADEDVVGGAAADVVVLAGLGVPGDAVFAGAAVDRVVARARVDDVDRPVVGGAVGILIGDPFGTGVDGVVARAAGDVVVAR